MRVLASSDWHLSPDTAPLVWATIRQLTEDARKNGADVLVVAGDLLEQARSLDGGLMLTLRSMLREFPGDVIVVQGNHDQIVRGDWSSSPLLMLEGGNVRVPDRPTFTEVGLVVPYSEPRDWARLTTDALADEPDVPRVTWAHQGFKGAYQNLMRRDRDGLALPPGLRTTITGHYHMPQNLGPLIYCGSPYQTGHAETGQIKSFLAFADLRAGVDCPLPDRVAFDRIGVQYWTLVWDPAREDPPALPPEHRDGDVVRLVVDATRAEVQTHDKRLRKAGLETATIVARPSARQRRATLDSRNGTLAQSTTDYLIDVCGPDVNMPDPHDVIRFAQENDLWPG